MPAATPEASLAAKARPGRGLGSPATPSVAARSARGARASRAAAPGTGSATLRRRSHLPLAASTVPPSTVPARPKNAMSTSPFSERNVLFPLAVARIGSARQSFDHQLRAVDANGGVDSGGRGLEATGEPRQLLGGELRRRWLGAGAGAGDEICRSPLLASRRGCAAPRGSTRRAARSRSRRAPARGCRARSRSRARPRDRRRRASAAGARSRGAPAAVLR